MYYWHYALLVLGISVYALFVLGIRVYAIRCFVLLVSGYMQWGAMYYWYQGICNGVLFTIGIRVYAIRCCVLLVSGYLIGTRVSTFENDRA